MNKDIELENALINIETSENNKRNSKMRPKRKTTPKKGDFNYDEEQKGDREDSQDSSRYSSDNDGSALDIDEDIAGYEIEDENSMISRTATSRYEKSDKEKHRQRFGYAIAEGVDLTNVPRDIAFRRYRVHVRRMLDRLEPSGKGHKVWCDMSS